MEWLCHLRQILHLLKKKYTTYLLNLTNLKFELTLHAVHVAAFALEGQPKVSYFTWLYLFRKRDDALICELLQCCFKYFVPLLLAFHSCPSTSFTCANGRCVPYSDRCDHYNDCGDNSDEAGCRFRACNKTEFTWWRWDDSRSNKASNVLAFSKQQTSSHRREIVMTHSTSSYWVSPVGNTMVDPGNTPGNCADKVQSSWRLLFGRGDKEINRHQICSPHSAFFEPLTISKGPQKTR